MAISTSVYTLAQLQAELVEVEAALSAIRNGGQSYTINSGPGGTSRTFTGADYDTLRNHKKDLESKIETLSETRATFIRPNW